MSAADSVGVYLESLDTIDRDFRVLYVPPANSVYATAAVEDTVYCALVIYTAWEKRGAIFPMHKDSSARYHASISLPDSTYHLRIEICLPTTRVPEGISGYQIGPLGGFAWEDTTVSEIKIDSLTKTLSNDPLLHADRLLNIYFYPVQVGEQYIVPPEHFDRTFHLACKYPRSALGRLWLERFDPERINDVAAVRRMIDAWRTSWDVDVFSAVAYRLLNDSSQLYDPSDALWFIERAENSARNQIAFRSGENIFASMGRMDALAAQKITALDHLKRYSEAKTFGRAALRKAENEYGRERIIRSLKLAAVKAGDSTFVHELNDFALPVVNDFTYTTITGETSSVAQHKGKIVVFDFWFAGCAGCALEHRSLNDLAMRYGNDTNVVFLSVSLNDTKTLNWYLSKHPLAFQVIPDGDALCEKLGVTAFPTHVVLDKQGATQLWETGGSQDAVENLGRMVKGLLE